MTALIEQSPPWLRERNRFADSDTQVSPFVPPADVLVTQEGVSVYMDIPGVHADALDVELENDTLTVRGERPYPYAGDSGRVVKRLERGFGPFERTLRVPRDLDPNAIEATMAEGVLTLRLPKPESLKPHRIPIKGGAQHREPEAAAST
jgi:HSP20 family protein